MITSQSTQNVFRMNVMSLGSDNIMCLELFSTAWIWRRINTYGKPADTY